MKRCCAIIDIKDDAEVIHMCPIRKDCKWYGNRIGDWIKPVYKDGECDEFTK